MYHTSTQLSNPTFNSPSEFIFPSDAQGKHIILTLYDNDITPESRIHECSVNINQPFLETYSSTHLMYTAGITRLVTLDEDRRVSRDLEHFSQENSTLQSRIEDLESCNDDLRVESRRRRERLHAILNENRNVHEVIRRVRQDLESTVQHLDEATQSDPPPPTTTRNQNSTTTVNPLFRRRRRRRPNSESLQTLLGSVPRAPPPPPPPPNRLNTSTVHPTRLIMPFTPPPPPVEIRPMPPPPPPPSETQPTPPPPPPPLEMHPLSLPPPGIHPPETPLLSSPSAAISVPMSPVLLLHRDTVIRPLSPPPRPPGIGPPASSPPPTHTAILVIEDINDEDFGLPEDWADDIP